MSSHFIISPIEFPSKLKIEASYLMEKLQDRWTNVVVKINNNKGSFHILTWEVNIGGEILDGGLRQDQQVLDINHGLFPELGEFALWYRSIISPEYQLFLYLSSLNKEPLLLTSEINPSEISNYFI